MLLAADNTSLGLLGAIYFADLTNIIIDFPSPPTCILNVTCPRALFLRALQTFFD